MKKILVSSVFLLTALTMSLSAHGKMEQLTPTQRAEMKVMKLSKKVGFTSAEERKLIKLFKKDEIRKDKEHEKRIKEELKAKDKRDEKVKKILGTDKYLKYLSAKAGENRKTIKHPDNRKPSVYNKDRRVPQKHYGRR